MKFLVVFLLTHIYDGYFRWYCVRDNKYTNSRYCPYFRFKHPHYSTYDPIEGATPDYYSFSTAPHYTIQEIKV